MPTTSTTRAQYANYRRPRWRRVTIVLVVIAVLLGAAGYAAYTAYRHVVTSLITPGCQAGSGVNALPLDPGQAPVAATIAGVAVRMGLPARALQIAYATALQESKLTNLPGGDRDSVGVFQQRPSQGWGKATQLEDPQIASTKFFTRLIGVSNYLTIPEDQAAQAVQHSADGSAYAQWEPEAAQLASAYTATPHAVTCWYTPPAKPAPEYPAVQTRLAQVFGPTGTATDGAVITGVDRSRSGLEVRVRSQNGWTVANWLMTHASMYGLTKVSYAGWKWSASLTETTWQAAAAGNAGSILAT